MTHASHVTPQLRSRTGRLAALLAAALLALGVAASPADAAITNAAVSDTTPADGQTVTVSGTATPGALVSIAQCNVDADPTGGTACNRTGGGTGGRFVRVNADATTGSFSEEIIVDEAFDNASFNPFVPPTGTNTVCEAAGPDQCAVQIIEYANNIPVDIETITITF